MTTGYRLRVAFALGWFTVLGPNIARAQAPEAKPALSLEERIHARVEAYLGELRERGGFPGGSCGIVLRDGKTIGVAVGLEDRDAERPLTPAGRLCSGSIGKTYVAASVLRLVELERLELDALAHTFFADEAWFQRLPNWDTFTVRQLLRHQSGLPRWVLDPKLWTRLLENPDETWTVEQRLAYVFDAKPLFEAGKGWSYADTNYIVLGAIVEKVTGRSFYEYVQKHLLEPLKLTDTVPSDRRRIPGLVQGHGGMLRQLGVPEKVIVDGQFVCNPQFEWCGGGFANTPLDLARWARALYAGDVLKPETRIAMLESVPARQLGPGTRYGLGVIVRATEYGRLLGHDGIFPGYLSAMGLFEEHGIAVAFQINVDDPRAAGAPMHTVLSQVAGIVLGELARR